MNRIRTAILTAAALFGAAPSNAQFIQWGQRQQPQPPQQPDKSAKTAPNEERKEDSNDYLSTVAKSVSRTRFTAPSEEIADECDKILDRLEERYGKPKVWRPFPVLYRVYTGNGVAGYTMYNGQSVTEVVVYESFENSVGATLDHELTHAFFFYFLNSSFDLFLNEGLAQNSEYKRRAALRKTVYRRYSDGEFWSIDKLYGRNSYDRSLLIYHEGFSVVDFLIARGGSEWIAEFMRDLVKRNNVEDSLRSFYGYTSLKALQLDWQNYIEGGQDRLSVPALANKKGF